VYQLDVPFDNISKLQFKKLEQDQLQLMVHLRKPVKVFQREIGAFGSDKPQMKEAPSPMMFSQPIY
jgi:hypothetical protein